MTRTRKLLLLPLLVLLTGALPEGCEFDDPPTLVCDMVSLQVEPGDCVEFENPCDDHQWHRRDSFRLVHPEGGFYPSGLYLEYEQEPEQRRFLCAVDSMSPIADVPVDFRYRRVEDNGVGTFRITVGASIGAVATANPSTIASGEASQLDVDVSGGTPPFSYAWSPAQFVDNPIIADPFASPPATTTFTVHVIDGAGLEAEASVVVHVGLGVEVSADPESVDPGQPTLLKAEVDGGTGPFTFAWTPADSIDDPASGSPAARPRETTTYSVLVTDAAGTAASGSVTVEVNLLVSASATPPAIEAGESAQLAAVAEGGSPPYTFVWTPVGSLDDETIPNPIADPTSSTTYTVTVTDSAGEQASATVDVDVSGTEGLTACISEIQSLSFNTAQAFADCSTGSIVQYRWWADFNFAGQLPTAITNTPASPVFVYDDPGNYDVRLEVIDAQGASDAVVVPFELQ